ncbi:MAG: hypothetical protein L0Z70_11495 [Chloroflexi bacterium]|nr:hypothetical protein [Chloroflexota bacterium]
MSLMISFLQRMLATGDESDPHPNLPPFFQSEKWGKEQKSLPKFGLANSGALFPSPKFGFANLGEGREGVISRAERQLSKRGVVQ